ncbi:hypothetical protein PPL_04602 [Heterostelium album PN500]|uniref:Uncharacterized protein n=1 Tax=Heterostelium pallidum (strain ATCC 26659 / Pp 5 / PN500) TaxID=670386 RepID=D3B812_HETP5|nr:hypothetical protein PPL_04602 [Heterostelium album PN500]EFA82180.1 hypothetical protein PPL_04602 [Heterostelium album PN500]|eukprot:XP_020434297.1 hypothetical protein PPL_04602 [Heterostelium album PN500]
MGHRDQDKKNKKKGVESNEQQQQQVPKPPVNLVTHITYVDINISASHIFRKLKKTTNIYFVLKSPINAGKFKKDGSWEDIEMLGSVSGIIANGGLFVQSGATAAFADATAVIGIASYIHKKAAETHHQTPGYRELFCSEIFKKTPHSESRLEPIKFRVGFFDLCGGDLDKKFLIEIYHHKKVGASINIGSLNVSINELRKQWIHDIRISMDKERSERDKDNKVGAKLYLEMITSAPIDIPKEYLYPFSITPQESHVQLQAQQQPLVVASTSFIMNNANGASVTYPSYSLPVDNPNPANQVSPTKVLPPLPTKPVSKEPINVVQQHQAFEQLSQSMGNVSLQHNQLQYQAPALHSHHLSYYNINTYSYQQTQQPQQQQQQHQQQQVDINQQKIQSIQNPVYQPPQQPQQYQHHQQPQQQQYHQYQIPQNYPPYNNYQHYPPNVYYPPQQNYAPQKLAPTNVTPPLPHQHIPIDQQFPTSVSK